MCFGPLPIGTRATSERLAIAMIERSSRAGVGHETEPAVVGDLRPAGTVAHGNRRDQRQVPRIDQRGVVRGPPGETERPAVGGQGQAVMRRLEVPVGDGDAGLHRQFEATVHLPRRHVVADDGVLVRQLRVDAPLVRAELPRPERRVEADPIADRQRVDVGDGQLERKAGRLGQRRRAGGPGMPASGPRLLLKSSRPSFDTLTSCG